MEVCVLRDLEGFAIGTSGLQRALCLPCHRTGMEQTTMLLCLLSKLSKALLEDVSSAPDVFRAFRLCQTLFYSS